MIFFEYFFKLPLYFRVLFQTLSVLGIFYLHSPHVLGHCFNIAGYLSLQNALCSEHRVFWSVHGRLVVDGELGDVGFVLSNVVGDVLSSLDGVVLSKCKKTNREVGTTGYTRKRAPSSGTTFSAFLSTRGKRRTGFVVVIQVYSAMVLNIGEIFSGESLKTAGGYFWRTVFVERKKRTTSY